MVSDKPMQVLGRRTIYSSDWINLQLVDIRLPDGQVLQGIHLLDYPHQSAAMIPIGADGRILLIDHYRFQTETRGWEIPAGKIDKGETTEAAVIRELREETGHRVRSLEYLGRYHPSNGSSNQVLHVFVGRDVERIGEIEDRNEVIGLNWFTPADVRDMIAGNQILDGLSLTGLCWAFTRGII